MAYASFEAIVVAQVQPLHVARQPAARRPQPAGLESGKGPCCDGSDSAHVEPSDWETQNKPRSHYKVRLDGVWADVPDEAVVTGPNRDGRTLVWYYDSWTGHSGIPGKVIKCFMPGTMT